MNATVMHLKNLSTVALDNSIRPMSDPKSEGMDESNCYSVFQPIDVETLLQLPDESVPYVIDGYLSEGGWAPLAGAPKVGKSTLAYEAVIRVATGMPWLGRVTKKGKVLVLAVEEHRREVARRFSMNDDEELYGHIKIWTGQLPFTDDVLDEIVRYVEDEDIRLVLVDTLHVWWGLTDENSSAEVLRAGSRLLQAIRRTSAAWLCNVHTRKSGGDFGQEIRESSALLGLVDVAMTLKRTESADTKRYLEAVSRYPDTPPKVVIGLGPRGYESHGDPEQVSAKAKAEQVWNMLTDEGQTIKELVAATGLSKQDVSRGLMCLGDRALRTGAGHKGEPYCYSKNSICPSDKGKSLGSDESNFFEPEVINLAD
jgi:predicted ATP-dependent serine protease